MHYGEADDVGAFAPDRRRGEQLDSRRVRGVSRGDVRRKAAPPRPKGAGVAGGGVLAATKKPHKKCGNYYLSIILSMLMALPVFSSNSTITPQTKQGVSASTKRTGTPKRCFSMAGSF